MCCDLVRNIDFYLFVFVCVLELCAPLSLDISQQSIRIQLQLLLHVASYHNFTLLSETIEQYMM